MKGLPLVATLALLAASLAGCVNESESTAEPRQRGLALAVGELQRVRVEVYANGTGNALLTIEVEREDGSDIATGELRARGTRGNATVEADVTGMDAAWVLLTLTDGSSAEVYVRVLGIAPDGSESLLREEMFTIQ